MGRMIDKLYEAPEPLNLADNEWYAINWETIIDGLAAVLFQYHAAQEIYGSDWNRGLYHVCIHRKSVKKDKNSASTFLM